MRLKFVFLFIFISVMSFGQTTETDSLTVYKLSEEMALKTKNWKSLIEVYYKKGNYLFNQSEYNQALPIFLKVDSIAKIKRFDNYITIKSLIRRAEISRTTYTKESTNLAYDIAQEALSRAKKINSQEGIHYTYVHLADLAQLRNELGESKKYLKVALDYYLKTDNEKWVSRMYLVNSVYYLGVDSLEQADESRLKAVQYLEGKHNDYEMAKAKYYYGRFLLYERENYEKAVPYLEDSKILHEKVNKVVDEIYHRCLRDLAVCYDYFGDYEKSTNYYKQAYELYIELTKKANRNTSRKLEAQYQTEKKEKEIALLKSEKELDAQKQKNQRNLLLGGLGITSIAGLFLFVLYRNRHKTNTKLKELDILKSNFFANISHEFRTPLTLISSPIDDVLTDNSISEKKREQFSVAKQNSERLLSLVNQLLDLSKIDAGQLKLHLQQGNVLQLISALSQSFTYSAKQKNINLNLNIKQSDENVWFDKDAVEKITVNLLSNALKYTPENGSVVCDAYIENHKLVLQVKNTGTGLTYEESNHIFDRFYQTNEQNQGTGIGLALVKELVELHKGTIQVISTPNEWTSFKVMLPLDKNSFKNDIILTTANTNIKTEVPFYSSPQIEDEDEFADSELPILLIAEDNNDLKNLLKQTFEENYNVISAPNGKLGVELALEHIPDLIISDIMMPEKDGVELTNALKNDERSAHIPIILLTAKADVESKFTGIDTGADDYITKPFDKKLLVLKVEKLIESRRKLQSRYSQEVILKPKDIAFTNLDEIFLNKVQIVLDNQLVESSFNVEDFSKAVGMSRMQLHRKIKALTGLSASEFIRSQRLKLAAQLLKNSDINISQVGYSVGFNDHAYFSKCFKDIYKCTPTEYAKKS